MVVVHSAKHVVNGVMLRQAGDTTWHFFCLWKFTQFAAVSNHMHAACYEVKNLINWSDAGIFIYLERLTN